METTTFNNRKIYSLRDIAESLRNTLAKTYTKDFYVKAEIAKLNYYPHSGHCYPDLVDKQGNTIKAQMRGMIWANDYAKISKKFTDITQNPLVDGLSILFLATLSYHPTYGISLVIKDIEPEFSLGEMIKDKNLTIKKLKDEKVFDLNKQKYFPLFPKKIAIISVATGKGYQDYMNITLPYQQRYNISQVLFPAMLQGDGAVQSILSQLKLIKQYVSLFEIVIIIRGGGGDVGLSCYDNYELAKEIATFPIPVITGIGHSTNLSIADLVAYHSAITPTDTANYLITIFENYLKTLQNIGNSLERFTQKTISSHQQQLNYIQSNLSNLAKFSLYREQEKLTTIEEKLKLLHPENILKRGFSITIFNKKPVINSEELKPGDIVETQVYQGKFKSIIK